VTGDASPKARKGLGWRASHWAYLLLTTDEEEDKRSRRRRQKMSHLTPSSPTSKFGSAATKKFEACVRATKSFAKRVLFSRHCMGIDEAMAHARGHL
jgi:hypothetical protein